MCIKGSGQFLMPSPCHCLDKTQLLICHTYFIHKMFWRQNRSKHWLHKKSSQSFYCCWIVIAFRELSWKPITFFFHCMLRTMHQSKKYFVHIMIWIGVGIIVCIGKSLLLDKITFKIDWQRLFSKSLIRILKCEKRDYSW